MIIGNYAVLSKTPARFFAGTTLSEHLNNFQKPGPSRNRYLTLDKNAGVPYAYRPPYTFIISQTSGAMSTRGEITGIGEFDASIAGGRNGVATIAGTGSFSATGALIVQAIATIAGTGAVTANLNAPVNLTVTIAGIGSFSGTMVAKGFASSTIAGVGAVDPDMNAMGNMEAEVSPFTELSPENLAAAVWNALAADYNEALTMGEKMNDAGSAGDPWSTSLPGSYIAGQAGHIVSLIAKILRNKTTTDPSTGTITVYDDDGTTVLLEADLFEDVAGTTPYDSGSTRIDRRDRMV